MQLKQYIYSDPTGGGDDLLLVLPEMWEPPQTLRIGDRSGDRHDFNLDPEELDDLPDTATDVWRLEIR